MDIMLNVKKLLEDLDSSHKDQMATMILSTATEFKNRS